MKLVEVWGNDYDIAIECTPPLLTIAVAMAKYLNGVCQTEKIRTILRLIKRDSERLLDLPEYEVLHYYALEGRKAAVCFAISMMMLTSTYLTLAVATVVHDIVTEKNASEGREFLYQLEYHVDPEKYFYLITFHTYVTSAVSILLIIALDTMYIAFVYHACALFAVTGFRLRTAHILNQSVLKDGKDLEKYKNKEFTAEEQSKIYKRLEISIKEHRRALEYTNLVQSMFSVSLFIQMSFNILCLSITGVQALLKMGNLHNVARLIIWIAGQLFSLFFLCFPGQKLTDFSESVYYNSLECMWYMFSKKTQVVYQFLVINTTKPCKLTALKVTSLTMETFLSVTQAAVSYFTVLSSTL